jgi:LPS-assembly protein
MSFSRRPGSQAARPGARRRIAFAVVALCGMLGAFVPAAAQYLQFPQVPKKPPTPPHVTPQGQKQMLVSAREIDYNYSGNQVSAVGNVQIYYDGSTLEADKVVYDQVSKRLHAEGNVRLTEADGKVTYGNVMDLSDDYRDGFVDSLRLDGAEQTRMAASEAERTKGNFTVFHNGVYTACEPCKDNPKKPPLWQVKAARIIHDQKEKMIYFEDASVEFFGWPVAWFPYFSTPDPTVKRKTGFLMPSVSGNSITGIGVEVPYYWALAPNYDVTVAPKYLTKEGLLMQGEFRQRLIDGAYQIRGSGIHQEDPNAFPLGSQQREWRGSLESSGQFALNKKWVWGWDALLLSDKFYLSDYSPGLSAYKPNLERLAVTSEGVSRLYLTGVGNRSYFDIRSLYYLGFSGYDSQSQIPVIHPVVNYDYVVDHPVIGGELGYNFNFTSLSRTNPDFGAINQQTLANQTASGLISPNCLFASADPRQNCVMYGVPGDYNRFSAKAEWRRTITDSFGQQFTPFATLRADAANMNIQNDPNVANFIQTGESNLLRVMPTVGLEYRYPFISVHSWGTQTITPIAQVIARPNETQVGRFPNEDAQSLVFDASNLFRVDKFAGWDRVEGGGRANYGLQYTAQMNEAGYLSALFGESYQLFGENSYAQPNPSNTGINSGLDTTASDYVGNVSYKPNSRLTFSSRFRFDHSSFDLQRLELETSLAFDRWSVSVLYGDYAAQPEIGFLDRRQGILTTGSLKVAQNWVLFGGVRYDLNAEQVNSTSIGVGYVDDCLILSLNYATGYQYTANLLNTTKVSQVMLTLSLRTIGSTTSSQVVSGGNNGGVQTGFNAIGGL